MMRDADDGLKRRLTREPASTVCPYTKAFNGLIGETRDSGSGFFLGGESPPVERFEGFPLGNEIPSHHCTVRG
jgi:hypothetical protein